MKNELKKLYPKAEKYIKDQKRLTKLVTKGTKKAHNLIDKDKRNSISDDFKISLAMVKDWSRGDASYIPKKSILMIVAAIIYFVMPIDLIPDFIVGTGLIDDFAVITYVLSMVRTDIHHYRDIQDAKNLKGTENEEHF